ATEELTDDNHVHRIDRRSSKHTWMRHRRLNGLCAQPYATEPAKRLEGTCPAEYQATDNPTSGCHRSNFRRSAMALQQMSRPCNRMFGNKAQSRCKRLRNLYPHRVDRIRCLFQPRTILQSFPRLGQVVRLFGILVLNLTHLVYVLCKAENVAVLLKLRGKDDRCTDSVDTWDHRPQLDHLRGWNSRQGRVGITFHRVQLLFWNRRELSRRSWLG